jgi:hypothetical protein
MQEETFLSILMPRVINVNFSQFVDLCATFYCTYIFVCVCVKNLYLCSFINLLETQVVVVCWRSHELHSKHIFIEHLKVYNSLFPFGRHTSNIFHTHSILKTSATKVMGNWTSGGVAITTNVAATKDVGSYWIGTL